MFREKVIKNGPSTICGRKPLKNLKGYGYPQILLGPFLNTLSHIFHECKTALRGTSN